MKTHKKILQMVILVIPVLLFQQCCANQGASKVNDKIIAQHHIKPTPRGIIEATIIPIQIIENNTNSFCKVRIKEVLKIGGGIRPIAANTEYTFHIETEIKDQLKSGIGETFLCHIVEVPQIGHDVNNYQMKISTLIKN
jgi:hypothetical protein